MTTATAKMTVGQYRDLIAELSDAFAGLRSIARESERTSAVAYVQKTACELMDANCPKATERDTTRAERLIDQTAEYVIKHGGSGETAESFAKRIMETPNAFAPASFVVDWGTGRGQGKRSGRMVKGAMSDCPRSKKRYQDIYGNIPGIDAGSEGKALRDELVSLRFAAIPAYLKCRSAGHDHETAMRFAYEAMGDCPHGTAFLYAKGVGDGQGRGGQDRQGPLSAGLRVPQREDRAG